MIAFCLNANKGCLFLPSRLIRTVVRSATKQVPQGNCSMKVSFPDRSYEPFIFEGCVSLTNDEAPQRPVKILRDTGAAQSFILSVLPLSDVVSVC